MEQDLGLQKLQISDPMAPPPPPKEYDSASLGSETVPVHTPPPGITIDGKMWQQDDTSDVSTPVSARPVSVRNLAVAPRNSTRPARFIKADQPLQHPGAAQIPAELQPVQRLYDLYRSKVYIEGYLFKKNETTGKRSIAEEHPWVKSYVELSGPVLTVWDAEIEEGDVTPQYINIADSVIELNEHGFIALRTSGSARYLFDAPDQDVRTRDRWVRALRLSCFEGTRIHEIYTKKFIMRHRVIEEDGEEQDLLATPKTKMEGYLQVRFSGVNEWQKYWVVVSDRRDEKKLFGKKSVPSRGQLMFYETKKAKQPIMKIVDVVQAYTLYPDSPQLVDLSTLIKVDGSIGTAASADQVEEAPTTTSLLMMTTNNTELVEWLIGVYDAFKLYGRPSQLLRDPTNTNSLSFGEIVTSPRLFLEVTELEGVNVQTETARQNNEAFVNIMLNKMRQHMNRVGVQGAAAAAPPPPASGMGPRTMSMPQIAGNQGGFRNPRSRTVSADQDPGNVPRASMMPQSMSMGRLSAFPSARGPMQPPGQRIQPSRNTMLAGGGKVVYNSDDSEEEDDDDAEEDSDDDDDSVFGHKTGAATSSSSTSALKKSSAVTGSSLNLSLPTTEQASQQTAIETEHPKIVVGEDEEEQTQRSQQQLTESSKDEGNKKKKKIQPTASDSEEESEEDQQDSEDDDDDQESTKYTPHRPRSRWPQQTPQNLRASAMPPPMGHPQGFADNEYPPEGFGTPQPYPYPAMVDEDGPIIPQLGENFANPHSLLGSVRPEHISAKEMAEHAKATGQPLVDIPYKPPEPRAGLVGMISQIEQNKKELSKGRMLEQEKERMMFERERERYLMEQRQSMMPPNMMGGMNMGMMDPRMTMMGPQLGMMNGNNGRPMMMPMMDPRMTMMMPMMDPRMSMMPPGMMGMGNNNNGNATSSGSHVPSMMMPMMDPRMSMMPPQMMMNPMMYGMFNPMMQQQQQQQQQRGPGGIPEEEDEDDEEDNLPLGQQQHQQQQNSRLSPSPIPSTSKSGNK